MRVFSSQLVLLPGDAVPTPGTIEVVDGRIVAVHDGARSQIGYPDAEFVQVPQGKVLLPGLVE